MRHSTLRIAWRNLGRNRKRTLLAVGAIALGQFTLVFVNCMMAGSFNQVIETITGPLVGHVQIHNADWREERAVDLYIDDLKDAKAQLEALPHVTSVLPRIFAPALSASGERTQQPADAQPSMVVGVDVALESQRGGMLESTPAKQLPGDGAVVLGRILANKLGVAPGQQVAIIGQDADGFPVSDLFTVTGLVDGGVDLVKTMGIVMSVAEAGELLGMPDQAHELVVQGEDYRQAEQLAAAVKALPAFAEAEVLTWRDAIPELTRMLDLKKYIDLIFLAIVFIASAAGIANTSMMSTFERTHEFGMLLAIGSRPARITGMVLVESITLGLVGVAIGSILGTAAVLITSHTGINYAALGGHGATEEIAFAGVSYSFLIYPVFEMKHVIFGICAVTATSVLASVWPAALAARLEPVEAMHT